MRKVSLMLCLLMMTAGLSGCLGGSDVETSEGDDVVPGELTDDWPTYYVPSANDLPTCDTTTLGRLYYVEADTNFQACMSTGWQVVQIGGSNANVVLNQVPVIETNFWALNDDYIIDTTGDGEYDHILVGMHWDAVDIDGTIAQIGIDYDGDNTIDINLPGNSGIHSEEDYILDGETIPGLFAIPLYDGITVHRSITPTSCLISVTRSISVIAIDDDGATGIATQTLSAFDPHVDSPIGDWHLIRAHDVLGSQYIQDMISTSDYDWITGAGSSPCPALPTFSFTAETSFTTGTNDVLGTLTLTSGSVSGIGAGRWCGSSLGPTFFINIHYAGGGWNDWSCVDSSTDRNIMVTENANGDEWVISESGISDVCNDSNSDCARITMSFGFDQIGDDEYCMDSSIGYDATGNACEG
jgi:hypothetical protein